VDAVVAAIAVGIAIASSPEATHEPAAPLCDRDCVVIAGADTQALSQAVAAHLGGLELATRVADLDAPAPKQADVGAARARWRAEHVRIVVWLVRDEQAVRIRLLDVERGGLFERELVAADDLATAEAVGVVVRRAVDDVLVGEPEPEGMTTVLLAPAPRPAPVPIATSPSAAAPPPRPVHRLRLPIDYVGEAWAREQPWQSAAAVGVGWIAPFGLHVGVQTRIVPPLTVRTDAADLRVVRHPIEIGIGYAWRRRRLAIDATVVGIVDVLTATSTAGRPDVVARDSTRVDGGIAPRIRVGVRALDWLVVGGGFGLDVFPAAFAYAVQIMDVQRTLLRPRRVRPQLQIGLAFEPRLQRRRAKPR